MGVQLPYADPVAVVEAVARDTADNRSSMLQDLERGAPTEIDAICGAVVGAGDRLGVPTPVNRCLWQLVRALETEDS
jgi:2-dehydropantoate 2-reductase